MHSDMKDIEISNQGQRRDFIVFATTLVALGIPGLSAAQDKTLTILVLGDSLSAEYGLRRGAGWVALMGERLEQSKTAVNLVNASISGETSSGGRSRLPDLLQRHQPDVVIIELGANDALRGLPLTQTQNNLQAMAQASKQLGARVVLVGMQVPPNYGRDYNQRFSKLFKDVAKAEKIALVPFMLKGVADVPDSGKFFQADRIHPNERAHPTILSNIWPEVEKLIR